MSYPVYYPIEGDTLPVLFDTFDGGTGASITMSGLAVTDIEIYKDGVATTRASESGYTLLDTDGIDFDGLTGIHGFSIDLSDNDDAGFYTVGPWYHVVVSTITIDGQTVSFIAAAFRIQDATRGMAGTALPDAAANAAGGLPISAGGALALDTQLANTHEVTAARMGALTDWIDGGRLDLILDGRAAPGDAMDLIADAVDSVSVADAVLTAAKFAANAIALAKLAADVQARLLSTGAVTNLNASAQGIVVGAAIAGTLSTTQMTTNLTEVTDDHYIGRVVVFTSGDLAGQATDVTDYTGASKMLTFTALTEAPSATDDFVLV